MKNKNFHYYMAQKSNLSEVARTVHKALTPFYDANLRNKDEKGQSLADVLNKMSRYGSELAKELDPAERDFFEKQIRPAISFVAMRLVELRKTVQEEKAKNQITETEANVKTNFLAGLKKEASKAQKLLL